MSSKVATKMLAPAGVFRTPSGLYGAAGGRKYLNSGERARLLDAGASLSRSKTLFISLLAWTGARISEILALDATAFQIDRGIVAFRTLKRRRYVVREVPIPPELMSALEREFHLGDMQRDRANAGQRLWPCHRATAWRWIKLLMEETSITGASACPRGFRHGFGVGAVQAGIPLNLVQRWLGHARLTTTAIYTEATGPEEHAFAARLWNASPRTGKRRGFAVVPSGAPVPAK